MTHLPPDRPDAERPAPPILEANLRALLTRAYVPLRADGAFRERLEARWLDGCTDRFGRTLPGPVPRAARRSWIPRLTGALAAAAAVLVIAAVGLRWGGEAPETPAARPGLAQLLAAGDVAVRSGPGEPWRALAAAERAGGVRLEGDHLELATPVGATALARVEDDAVRVAGASRLRLMREYGHTRAHVLEGAVVVEGADAGAAEASWRIVTDAGRVDLRHGLLRVAFPARSGSECAELTLAEGVARVDGRDGPRDLAPGETVYLCAGEVTAVASAVAHGGPVSADDGGPRRQAVGAEREPDPGPEETRREVASGELVGLVSGPDRTPVERFQVVVLRNVDLPSTAWPELSEHADSSGLFHLEGLVPGSYGVFVVAEGHATWHAEVEVRAERPTEIVAELGHGGRLVGTVVAAETGEPLEGAFVVSETDAPTYVLPFWPEDLELPFALRRAVTAPDGSFELRGLSAGSHVLRVSHPDVGADWLDDVSVVPGAPAAPIAFEVPRGCVVAGRVERDDGEPWSDAFVVASSLEEWGVRPCLSSAYAQADRDGVFRFENLPAGPYVLLHFPTFEGGSGPSGEPRVQYVEVRRDGTTEVVFGSAERGTRLFGRLLGADGAPAAAHGVTLITAVVDVEAETPTWRAVTTAPDGSYEFRGVLPGTYGLSVSRAMGSDMIVVAIVTIDTASERELDLHLLRGGVAGRVATASGEPVDQAGVVFERYDPERAHFVFAGKVDTGADGRYAAPGLPPGSYRVIFVPRRGLGAESVPDVLVPADGELVRVDATLYPGGGLALVVVDADGRPVEGARVVMVSASGAGHDTGPVSLTDERGRIELWGLPPGVGRFRVVRSGFASRDIRPSIHVDTLSELRVVLDPAPAAPR